MFLCIGNYSGKMVLRHLRIRLKWLPNSSLHNKTLKLKKLSIKAFFFNFLILSLIFILFYREFKQNVYMSLPTTFHSKVFTHQHLPWTTYSIALLSYKIASEQSSVCDFISYRKETPLRWKLINLVEEYKAINIILFISNLF